MKFSAYRISNLVKSMEQKAIILGGGIAGLVCTRELAAVGVHCTIVEKGPILGGHAARFACKATDTCQRCGACSVEDLLHSVAATSTVTIMPRTTLTDVQRENGQFHAVVLTRPPRIVPESCDCCGACREICPVPGALLYSPFERCFVIDEDRCLFFQEGSCRLCVDACQRNAIQLTAPGKTQTVSGSIIILATGFRPYDPSERPRLGYGRIAGVVSAAELDALLRSGSWSPPVTAQEGCRVAFIQCVGSRDAKIGRNYCSQVCCGYALRMARLLHYRFPYLETTMFYMDIQNFQREFAKVQQEVAKEIRLIRAIPSEVRMSEDGRPELVYQTEHDTKATEPFDMVILSVGIAPDPGVRTLQQLLGIQRNLDGFLGEDNESVLTTVPGVFVAGTVQGPRSIPDTASHALCAAAAALQYLTSMNGALR